MKSFLIPATLSGLALFACSKSKQTSTEVENEVQVASITGIAATGYAMSNASWELITSTGTRIAQGTTDSYGHFSASMDLTVAAEELPWLVRVIQDGDTLTGLMSQDSSSSDSLFGLVNPISDYVTRRILGPAANNPVGGFQLPPQDSIDRLGQVVVEEVLGKGIQWSEFSKDHNYQPAVKSPTASYVPSANDMLLHSLDAEATRMGLSRRSFIDTLYRDSSYQVMNEKGFRLDVAANMALFGIPPETAQPQIKEWQASQGITDTNTSAYYQQMWDFRKAEHPDTTEPLGPQDPWSLTMQTSNQAMQRTAQTFQGAELDMALGAFNPGLSIITGIVYPLAETMAEPKKVQTRADLVGMVLSSLQPRSWEKDSASIRSLTHHIIAEYVTEDNELKPDSVRTLINTLWEQTTPAFSNDPRRVSLPVQPPQQYGIQL